LENNGKVFLKIDFNGKLENRMKVTIHLFVCLFPLIATSVSAECSYDACHKTDPNKLNIHLIAHSHDDVGWWLTPDGYYDASVRSILNTVTKSLQKNPERKFIQVESYFFHRWWKEQNKETQDIVKGLVNKGQLAFINGGWTVNDEGAAHYNNIIDQMTLGKV
jgi:lysosomal alpha-mannosidase